MFGKPDAERDVQNKLRDKRFARFSFDSGPGNYVRGGTRGSSLRTHRRYVRNHGIESAGWFRCRTEHPEAPGDCSRRREEADLKGSPRIRLLTSAATSL